MNYLPRVSIPSLEGTFECILTSEVSFIQLCQRVGPDNQETASLLVVAWTALIADSPIGARKPNRVIHRFLTGLMNDLYGKIRSYCELYDALCEGMTRDGAGKISIPYLKAMEKTPVFPEYLRAVRSNDIQCLRFVLSFLAFGKKTAMTDASLETIALHKWLEVENRLKGLVLPPFVDELRNIMEIIFSDWEAPVFLPKHGGGAVAERGVRGVNAKNMAMTIDRRLAYLYLRGGLLGDGGDPAMLPTPDGCLVISEREKPVSRLKFVTKNYKTKRSICMEPVDLQWGQQGLRFGYESYLERCYLSLIVDIKDQLRNRLAAQHGSRTGWVDTIDLAGASDSVAWLLVKAIFPSKVLKHLAATRSRFVELPDGSNFEISKFAPMGSALCFPVQSTIYSVVVLLITLAQAYGRDWRKSGCLRGLDLRQAMITLFGDGLSCDTNQVYVPPRVYGDDITCDKRVTSNVMEALSLLGFSINREKSFVGPGSPFRESCGGFYYGGYDVTPYLLKIKEIGRRISMDSMCGVIEHANKAWDYGYEQLRKHLIQFALWYPIEGLSVKGCNPILFVDDEGTHPLSIRCTVARNTHLKKRTWHVGAVGNSTNISLQRSELQHIVPGPIATIKHARKFDNYRLVAWWRSKLGGAGDSDLSEPPARADALGMGVLWKWTATV